MKVGLTARQLVILAADYFNEGLKDPEDGRKRFESCQFLWQQMKLQTEQLQEELNRKLFDNLISFLKKSHSDFHDQKSGWSCRVRSSEIPTAALLLGKLFFSYIHLINNSTELMPSSPGHWQAPPVVVVFKDLESFPANVLQEFIVISSYVENQTPETQVKFLTNDSYLKETAQTFLENLHSYHENFIPVLRCLHQFTCILPKYPLGKQIRELYCACLEKKVWETEDYISALQLLRMLAKEELVATLQKCVEVLRPYSERQLGGTLKKLEEFLVQLQCHEGKILATLLEMKETRRTKKLSKFESLRLEVIDFLDSLVRDYLAPPETQPLYEVVYFSAASILRKHLNAVPRIAFHTALNNPSSYLKSLENEAGALTNAAPDICIAYKLHLECGRLINLYDWLEAFATVVNTNDDSDLDSLEPVDEMTHARFIRAVSELELLGFVKPSKQKTDHVARLTWGGC
uniref:Origin recognition complex subunit 3 n=1 Tax=Pyxicephalus adspersus TaxID=30357 RepID=A0AAV3A5X5_PYXAD|nr:TPA: hypothetical protein GDO54_010740 [Pyxicephalus adspersus]